MRTEFGIRPVLGMFQSSEFGITKQGIQDGKQAGPHRDPERILVFQTAFLGDLILTLPLVQALHSLFPKSEIDLVAAPAGAEAARNHPAIERLIVYDKRGADAGMKGFLRLQKILRSRRYNVAFIPHRSLRSAALVRVSGIRVRIGFDRSAGSFLFTNIVEYHKERHEYRRNLDLLAGIGAAWEEIEYPHVYPGAEDAQIIEEYLGSRNASALPVVAIAPGTVWETKRWPAEGFTAVAKILRERGYSIVLIGGPGDRKLCEEIVAASGEEGIHSAAGMFSVLQSAEMIRRSKLLIGNDSAPQHLAVAVGTPVLSIFGATTPSIGFAPYGARDIVIENTTLSCRPCSIHGGAVCPIGTFACMKSITAEMVVEGALKIMNG